MSIKQKIRSVFDKVTGKNKAAAKRTRAKTDAELAAEEVIHEEVFPKKASSKKCEGKCCKKPASKRTRPTNDNYQMIDPSNDTCDHGKS